MLNVCSGSTSAWRVEARFQLVREGLISLYERVKLAMPGRDRQAVARSYVQSRGRLSTTELGSILGISAAGAVPLIQKLERIGVVQPAWAHRKGRGFHYVLKDPVSVEVSGEE